MAYDPVYMRKWRRDHPNYHKEWERENPGYHALYAKEHPRPIEEVRAYAATWKANHPGYFQKHWDKDLRHSLWMSAKHRARANGREFTIVEADILLPADMICPLLGVLMEPRSEFAPTLDRKDSSKGYVPSNIWVISKRANLIKHDSPLEGWCLQKLEVERRRLAQFDGCREEQISTGLHVEGERS